MTGEPGPCQGSIPLHHIAVEDFVGLSYDLPCICLECCGITAKGNVRENPNGEAASNVLYPTNGLDSPIIV